MQTRSRRDLSGIDIKDLLLPQKPKANVRIADPSVKSEAPPKTFDARHLLQLMDRLKSQDDLLLEQRDIISDQRSVIRELEAEHAKLVQELASVKRYPIFMVLDTETKEFVVNASTNETSMLPLQIAWGIYRYDSRNQAELLCKETWYISDLICLSKYRDQIRNTSERWLQRIEKNMQENEFPVCGAWQIFERLYGAIKQYNVSTLVAYNISWDFMAIGNLLRFAQLELKMECPMHFDAIADNPFNKMALLYVDLMHEVIKKYAPILIQAGLKDGTVHRDKKKPGVIKLRKDIRYSKSIYSAEYVLKYFFGVSQVHVADKDVEQLSMLLQKCIHEFGIDDLEFNIMYPQRSAYHQMLHIAKNIVPLEESDESSGGLIILDTDETESIDALLD